MMLSWIFVESAKSNHRRFDFTSLILVSVSDLAHPSGPPGVVRPRHERHPRLRDEARRLGQRPLGRIQAEQGRRGHPEAVARNLQRSVRQARIHVQVGFDRDAETQ